MELAPALFWKLVINRYENKEMSSQSPRIRNLKIFGNLLEETYITLSKICFCIIEDNCKYY